MFPVFVVTIHCFILYLVGISAVVDFDNPLFKSEYDFVVERILTACPELGAVNLPNSISIAKNGSRPASGAPDLIVWVSMRLNKFTGIDDLAQRLSLSIELEMTWGFHQLPKCSIANIRQNLTNYHLNEFFLIPRNPFGTTWKPAIIHRNGVEHLDPFAK